MRFKVYLNCGCCDAAVEYQSRERIEADFARVGMTTNGTLVDDSGFKLEGVDTFYGFQDADDAEVRGLSYLAEQVKSKL